jgi:hypothetical protein
MMHGQKTIKFDFLGYSFVVVKATNSTSRDIKGSSSHTQRFLFAKGLEEAGN